MSGNTVTLEYSKKYGFWLHWGRETFFDSDRYMLAWDSAQAAAIWLQANHPTLTLLDPVGLLQGQSPAEAEPAKAKLGQMQMQL